MKALSTISPQGNAFISRPGAANQLILSVNSLHTNQIRPFYREIIPITILSDGVSKSIRIDEAASILNIAFSTLDYAAPSGALTNQHQGVSVNLTAPAEVHRVQFKSNLVIPANTKAEFYRKDGNTLSEKPTVSQSIQSRIANIASSKFTSGNFAIRLNPVLPFFTSNVHQVVLRGYPTGPRLGIALGNNLDEATFFWRAVGEIGKPPIPASEGEAELGGELAKAMQQLLDESLDPDAPPQPLPPEIQFNLLIESDAPCRLTLHGAIAYQLALDAFPDNQNKIVLRFSGSQLQSETVPITLPAAVLVRKATIDIDKSLSSSITQKEGATQQSTSDSLNLNTDNGILIEPGSEVSLKRELASSQVLSSVGIAILPFDNPSEMQITVRLDTDDKPEGQILSTSNTVLNQPGDKTWAIFTFPNPIVLQTKIFWITLTSLSGKAIWLIDDHIAPIEIKTTISSSVKKKEVITPDATSVLHELYFLPSNTPPEDPQLEMQESLDLRLGGQIASASLTSESPDKMTFDFTDPLQRYINGHTGGLDMLSIPLEFVTAQKGIVTVYPPEILFDDEE